MKIRLLYLALLTGIFFIITPATIADAATYYVSTTGNDSNLGIQSAPFATIQKAVDTAVAGDLIYVRGGRYIIQSASQWEGINIRNKNGTASNHYRLETYPGETPILDGSQLSGREAVLAMRNSSYWSIKGLHFQYSVAGSFWATMGIILYNSSNNTFDDLEISYMDGAGMGIYTGSNNNTIMNSSAHHNYDINGGGGNSDGFQAAGETETSTTPTGNKFINCESWNNGDDGFDLWESYRNEIHNSRAWHNGYRQDGTTRAGDGNGYKLGRGLGQHIVTYSVAWDNPLYGFDNNGATGAIKLYNTTAYNNGYNYSFPSSLGAEIKNNISFSPKQQHFGHDSNLGSFNTWNLSITNPQFLSTNPSDPNFLRLSATSPARDAGTNVGYSGSDTTPDLGAYAYAVPSDTTAPSTPSNLSASAVSSTRINLSWTESTDAGGSGLKGYRVERCEGSACTNFSQIAASTGTTYSDMSGLAANTAYRYCVRAEDNATPPNLSGYSNIANTITQSDSNGDADIATGLVGHWRFDEGSGTTAIDSSSNGNHGTLMNGPVRVTGKIDQALNFNPNNDLTSNTKVTVPAVASLNDLPQISISAWVYPRSGGESNQGTVVAKELSAGPNTGWVIDMGNSPINRIRFLVDYDGTNLIKTSPEGSLVYNKWQHVLVTWNGSPAISDVNIYIDGILQPVGVQTSNATGNRVSDAAVDLGIGGLAQNNFRDFDGLIDDVRIYNRALSSIDIQTLYSLESTSTPTPSGPTACHSLDATQPVPSGYAAAYNPFTTEKELLLSAECNATTTSVTLGNGNMGDPTNWDGRMWVWNQGYEPVVLRCLQLVDLIFSTGDHRVFLCNPRVA